MRVVRVDTYGSADVMKIVSNDVPILAGSQLLVKVHFAGVNPVDTYHRSGANGYGPPTPFTPGLDGSGIIESVGTDVKGFAPGDRVYFTALRLVGTYGEYCMVEEHEIRRLPQELSFEQGAGLFVPYYTAYYAMILRGNAQKGETIFIHGASGAVGQACLQIAKAMEMRVIATAGSPEGLELLSDLGADMLVNHRDPDHMKKALELNSGQAVPLIIEFLADRNLQTDMESCAKNGRIVIVGNRGETNINARMTMTKNLDIRGMSLFNASKDEIDQIEQWVSDGASEGWLRPRHHRILDLDAAPEAHTMVTEGPSLGRVLLRI